MKKTLVGLIAAVMLTTALVPVSQAANANPGGFQGFLAGCCFGIRTGADYNDLGTGKREYISWFLVGCCLGVRAQEDYRDGKDWHWRDVGPRLPYIGIIFQIWDGIDTAGGKGRADLQKNYGATYY